MNIRRMLEKLIKLLKEFFSGDDDKPTPDPEPTPTPTPTPTPDPEPQPSSEDFTPPERKGTGEWSGTGKFNTFKDLGRASEKSSSTVIVSGWFNANGWSGGNKEQAAGFCFANKGKLGSHWGLCVLVRPNGLVWNATKGEIVASASVSTKVWHHLKAEATSNSVKFWLDGKLLKTGDKSFSGSLIQDTGESLKIGGYDCPWPNATWFNQSLNGKISDVSVSMK